MRILPILWRVFEALVCCHSDGRVSVDTIRAHKPTRQGLFWMARKCGCSEPFVIQTQQPLHNCLCPLKRRNGSRGCNVTSMARIKNSFRCNAKIWMHRCAFSNFKIFFNWLCFNVTLHAFWTHCLDSEVAHPLNVWYEQINECLQIDLVTGRAPPHEARREPGIDIVVVNSPIGKLDTISLLNKIPCFSETDGIQKPLWMACWLRSNSLKKASAHYQRSFQRTSR